MDTCCIISIHKSILLLLYIGKRHEAHHSPFPSFLFCDLNVRGHFLFRCVDDDGNGCIACDVEAGAEHVEDSVDAGNECKAFERKSDGLEYHGKHDEACARDAGGADGGKGAGEDDHHHLVKGERYAEYVGDENGADAHIESGAVHIDGRAKGQYEGCDVAVNAEFFLDVLHVDRKRACGRAGGEGDGHRFGHAAEESDRAHVSGDGRHGRVDADGVDGAADQHADDDGEKRQEHFRSVHDDDRKQQAEDADRGGLHDHGDDLVADFSECIKEADQCLGSLAADGNDAGSDEEGEDDDWQDVCLGHRCDRVRRDHVDEDLHDARGFLDLRRGRSGHAHAGARINGQGYGKADHDGDSGGHHVNGQRLDTDTAQFLHIPHGRHADDQGTEDDRNDHHLDQIDEHGADRGNPCLHRRRRAFSQYQSDDDGQDKGGKNL